MIKYIVLVVLMLVLTSCRGKDGAGATGAPGPQGQLGPQGADGEAVTTVLLCPGKSSRALCINNTLYSLEPSHSNAKGGLRPLPNGEYRTKGCCFTVNGCAVELK